MLSLKSWTFAYNPGRSLTQIEITYYLGYDTKFANPLLLLNKEFSKCCSATHTTIFFYQTWLICTDLIPSFVSVEDSSVLLFVGSRI